MDVIELIKEKIENITIDNKQRMLFKYEITEILDEVAQEYPKTPTPTHPIPLDTQQYIEELEAKVNNNGWIPCGERLPEAYDNVFVCTEDGGRTIAHTTFDQPFCFFDMHDIEIDGGVIAWQPLPTLPAPYKEGDTK